MNAPTGPDEVRRIAALAKLRISDDEAARFAADFAAILAHLGTLRDVDTSGVTRFVHPLALTDVLRDDTPRDGLTRSEALAGAPDATASTFRVPRVRPDGGA